MPETNNKYNNKKKVIPSIQEVEQNASRFLVEVVLVRDVDQIVPVIQLLPQLATLRRHNAQVTQNRLEAKAHIRAHHLIVDPTRVDSISRVNCKRKKKK
jgi:hypothetical protein